MQKEKFQQTYTCTMNINTSSKTSTGSGTLEPAGGFGLHTVCHGYEKPVDVGDLQGAWSCQYIKKMKNKNPTEKEKSQ